MIVSGIVNSLNSERYRHEQFLVFFQSPPLFSVLQLTSWDAPTVLELFLIIKKFCLVHFETQSHLFSLPSLARSWPSGPVVGTGYVWFFLSFSPPRVGWVRRRSLERGAAVLHIRICQWWAVALVSLLVSLVGCWGLCWCGFFLSCDFPESIFSLTLISLPLRSLLERNSGIPFRSRCWLTPSTPVSGGCPLT